MLWVVITAATVTLLIVAVVVSTYYTAAYQNDLNFDAVPREDSDRAVSTEPVDVVITWVDTDDPDWWARFQAAKGGEQTALTGRIHNLPSHEITYAIRSIRKHLSWVRTIHLLTQRPQTPPGIEGLEGVVIVHHDECGLEEPTYNGMVVAGLIPFVPNLAERFIIMDDDVVLTRSVDQSYYFDEEGRPNLRVSSFPVPLSVARMLRWTDYTLIRIATNDYLEKVLGRRVWKQVCANHRPWPMRLSLLQDAHEVAKPAMDACGVVRSKTDIAFAVVFAINWLARTRRDEVRLYRVTSDDMRELSDTEPVPTQNPPVSINFNCGMGPEAAAWLTAEYP